MCEEMKLYGSIEGSPWNYHELEEEPAMCMFCGEQTEAPIVVKTLDNKEITACGCIYHSDGVGDFYILGDHLYFNGGYMDVFCPDTKARTRDRMIRVFNTLNLEDRADFDTVIPAVISDDMRALRWGGQMYLSTDDGFVLWDGKKLDYDGEPFKVLLQFENFVRNEL